MASEKPLIQPQRQLLKSHKTVQKILLSLLLFCHLSLNGREDRKQQMSLDLDIIKNIFAVQYAAAEWKGHCFSWDLEKEIKRAKKKIREKEHVSTKEYQRIVRDFCKSTLDYHVDAEFYSTEWAELPFRVKGVHERYFITYAEEEIFSSEGLLIPLQKGDELLYFEGLQIEAIVADFKKQELGNGTSITDQRLAEMLLTERIGALGHKVPSGAVSITVKHLNTGQEATYRLNWKYEPERITNHHATKQEKKDLLEDPFFLRKMVTPFFKQIALHGGGDRSLLGTRKTEIPPLGKIVWSHSDRPFEACLYFTDTNQCIAFLRIPHYQGSGDEVRIFKSLIAFFEINSDLLVIDQCNNPGGHLLYMYSLLSVLTTKPLKTLPQRVLITQKDVAKSHDLLSVFSDIKRDEDVQTLFANRSLSSHGYPLDYAFVQGVKSECQFLINAWEKGQILTDPMTCFGIESIPPDPLVRYTKPIIVLVNSLDFSCADLFPAILQDNKRALIFGSKTAGAGGYALFESYPNRFGIESISLTGSLIYRLDGSPIENLGVTPDVLYELSENDYQNNYADYKKALLDLTAKQGSFGK
jgi:hypothetical protein